MFPCFEDIVAGVPAFERFAPLAGLEETFDPPHPEDRYRPARPRPAAPRAVA